MSRRTVVAGLDSLPGRELLERVQAEDLELGEQVLIEVAPPAERAASFPCWAWMHVFCGRHLARSREEALAWHRRVRRVTGRHPRDFTLDEWSGQLLNDLKHSWERLFDPDLPAQSWERRAHYTEREAVMDEMRIEWVQSVRRFKGTRG